MPLPPMCAASPEAGLELVRGDREPRAGSGGPFVEPACLLEEGVAPAYAPQHGDSSGDAVAAPCLVTVVEAELRELHYSWAGDFEQFVGPEEIDEALAPVRVISRVSQSWSRREMEGRNTLLLLSKAALWRKLEELEELTGPGGAPARGSRWRPGEPPSRAVCGLGAGLWFAG